MGIGGARRSIDESTIPFTEAYHVITNVGTGIADCGPPMYEAGIGITDGHQLIDEV